MIVKQSFTGGKSLSRDYKAQRPFVIVPKVVKEITQGGKVLYLLENGAKMIPSFYHANFGTPVKVGIVKKKNYKGENPAKNHK